MAMMIQLWSAPPNEYLTLIGQFIVTMSHIETYIKQLMWKVSGIDHELGQLVTGGAPLDTIVWLVRQLYDKRCQNQLMVDDIESILNEVAALKMSRDHMAHRQWNEEHRGIILSNKALAKTAEAVEETPYTIEDLNKLCVRAHILSGRILRHLIHRDAVVIIEANYQGEHLLPPAPWLHKSTRREDLKGKRSGRTSPKPTAQP
jgi:hypothetical protein